MSNVANEWRVAGSRRSGLTGALVPQVQEAVACLEDRLGQLQGRPLVQSSEEQHGDSDDVDESRDEGEGEELSVLLAVAIDGGLRIQYGETDRIVDWAAVEDGDDVDEQHGVHDIEQGLVGTHRTVQCVRQSRRLLQAHQGCERRFSPLQAGEVKEHCVAEQEEAVDGEAEERDGELESEASG